MLVDDKGAPLDPKACEFAYRFPYAIYPTWTAAAKALGLAPEAAAASH